MKQLNNLISAFSAKPLILLFLLALLPTMASAQCPDNNHPHMIDLGLPSGTKWACFNVGASKPEDYGGYYAWGETEEKGYYSSDNYLDGKGTSYMIGKFAGTQYDAATANWGSPWVMPSLDKMNELKNDCTSEWTMENGVYGYRFTGTNGASIFFPAAGYRWYGELKSAGDLGEYWSSSLHESYTYYAYNLYFDSGSMSTEYNNRVLGRSIRPVVAGSSTASSIVIDENTFPDENFRSWVLARWYGQDGVLTEEEIAGVAHIDVNNMNIVDITGIEYFTALTVLDCRSNQLTSLNVSKNTALAELYCYRNNIKGSAMDALIASLSRTGGNFYALWSSDQNVVTKAQVAAAKEKGWTTYYFNSDQSDYGWKEYEGSGILIDETNFPDENFRNWVLAQDYGQDGVLTEDEVAAVISIDVRRKGIADLKGIEYFTALKTLSCYDNQLTSLDVSQNTALTGLYCSGNQLTSLDVSTNTELRWLGCHYNQLTSLDVSQNLVLTDLSCNNNQLTSLDVSKNTALENLNCGDNQLTALDVSKNTTLKELSCYKNQIKGAVMDALIAGLPDTMGNFFIEQNEVTKTQVAAAKEKGWTTYYWNYELSCWEEYEGSDPEIAPVDQGETIDIGNEIDENTNLDGNVVGDVYYCISSGDGSYDPEEGCVVVTKPTDDSAIDGKDIFGEDFKAGYTGFVFMVAPGKGTINVEAETTGNMVLKVKVGDNAPAQMEVNGKTKVSFSYDVSEPTMVFIYGSIAAAGAKGVMKAASTDMLKIYGIEVTSTNGIEAIDNGQLTIDNSPVYNLNGQRVESSKFNVQSSKLPKGIYIQNGKKVLVK